MIDLYLPDSTTLSVQETDSSFMQQEIMGDHTLTLYFSLPEYKDIPVGTYCYFMGQRFTLNQPLNIKKNAVRNLEFTLVLEAEYAKAKHYKLRNTIEGDNRLQFSMCARPLEFLQLIVDNMNRRDSGWIVGDCIDSTEKMVEFDHSFVLDALQMIADEFNTEWEIIGKKISLGKVEYFKDDPLPLSYGRGNGFCPGIGRANDDDGKAIDLLFVQGGDRNIDRSTYGSKFLLLPKSQTLTIDDKEYISSADGLSIQRKGKVLTSASNEDSLDLSNIYPSRVGVVSSVEVINADKNFYDFLDSSIPETLNYNDYIIAGESMTVRFQSGMLSALGVDFDLKYKHTERRFELVPQEIDGETMPNATYKPAIGDKYAIFGCMLPDAYFCDNETQSGASWDMFREAAKYLAEHEQQAFTFTGELQGKYAKENWLKIGGRLLCGSYIHFTDDQFAPDGADIRITGIKQYMHSPYSPTIELSNTVKATSFATQLQQIEAEKVEVSDKYKDAINYTKRTFRDAKETMEALQNAMLEGFQDSISPLTIQTMQLLVGDESLQFRFVSSKANPTVVQYNLQWDNNAKQLKCPAGVIQHLTLGINTIAASHEASEYKYWTINAYNSPVLDQIGTYYYLYAKCSKTAETAEFVLSETGIGLESVSGYYHLLVGLLNSEYEGDRSFVTMYGFTEILPGRISTDKIISQDGNSWFDLAQNAFKLGNSLSYINGVLTISSVDDLQSALTTLQNTVNGLDLDGIGGDNLMPDGESITKDIPTSYPQTAVYLTPLGNYGNRQQLEAGTYVFSAEKAIMYYHADKYGTDYYSAIPFTYSLRAWNYIDPSNIIATSESITVNSPTQIRDLKIELPKAAVVTLQISTSNSAVPSADQSALTKYEFIMTNAMLQKGTKSTAYQTYKEFLLTALQGTTTVVGGLVLSNTILLKDSNNNVYSGWTGLASEFTDTNSGKGIVFWSGGTIAEAQAGTAKYILYDDGSAQFGGGTFKINASGVLEVLNNSATKIIVTPNKIASNYIPKGQQTLSTALLSGSYTTGNITTSTYTSANFTIPANKARSINLYANCSASVQDAGYELQLSLTVKLQKKSGTSWVDVMTVGATSSGLEYNGSASVTLNASQTGLTSLSANETTYRYYIIASSTSNGTITIQANSWGASGTYTPAYEPKTVIGSDGILNAYDADNYFFVKNNGSKQSLYLKGLESAATISSVSEYGKVCISESTYFLPDFIDVIMGIAQITAVYATRGQTVPDDKQEEIRTMALNFLSKYQFLVTKTS